MDKELINKSIKGDRKAQEAFYRLCYARFIGVANRYAKNKEQAVDFFNFGFVKILLNLKKYDQEKPFEYWAKRVLINEILNELKKEKRIVEKEVVYQENQSYDIDESDDFNELIESKLSRIKELVDVLPPTTKKVFNLYMDGYKHSEIGTLLNMNENTSMWHYSEAKKKIKHSIIHVDYGGK